jgi:DNA-binding transcriptional regulator YhcF (GntR family)
MVQMFQEGPSRTSQIANVLGPALGQGLGEFTGSYFANKALEEVVNNPTLKNAPLSERQSALASALRPYGTRGQRVLEQQLAIENQRQQEQAISRLKNLDVKGKTPQEVIATYYEALQGHPKAGEIISAALPYALAKTQSEQAAQGLGSASDLYKAMQAFRPTGEMPAKAEVQIPYAPGKQPALSQEAIVEVQPKVANLPKTAKSSEKIGDSATDYLKQIRPDFFEGTSQYGNVPTFDFQSKSDLRPEEESKLRQNMTANNVLPEVQDQIIKRVREDINTRYNEAKDRYNLSKDQQAAIDEKWKTFREDAIGNSQKPGRLMPYLSLYKTPEGFDLKNTQQDLMNKYFEYASRLPVNLNPDAMHAQAMTLLQEDMKRINALKTIPAMPPIRQIADAKQYLNDIKEAYKPLAQEGFIETLREDAIYNKDMGNEEFHQTLYGEQTSKDVLNKIHSIKVPTIMKLVSGPEKPVGGKRYEVERANYVNQLSSALKTIGPNDDLVLARSMVLDNGATEKEFNDALQKANAEGLKLSPFQQSQLQEVRIPRQRPLWEFFTPEGWKSLINVIRGKR